MGRPPKSVEMLKSEKKSHRTKEELENREEFEKSLLTGIKIRKFPEVRQNKTANKEFNRVKKLLEALGKDDDLYSNVINRYCILKAEIEDFTEKIEMFNNHIESLENDYADGEIEGKEYFRLLNGMQRNIVDADKQIQNKRKMMFDIEKENLMTVTAALRAVPKKPVDDGTSEILSFIGSRQT